MEMRRMVLIASLVFVLASCGRSDVDCSSISIAKLIESVERLARSEGHQFEHYSPRIDSDVESHMLLIDDYSHFTT
jgi:DNA-directed RNA polymerase specialized sigma subunit